MSKPIAPGIPLVILPLGDSITQGFMWGTAPENSYRLPLLTLLTSAPIFKPASQITYIGSNRAGDFPNNAHDGFGGHCIHEVFPASSILRDDSNAYKGKLPNVVLVHIGTNDCNNDPPKAGCGEHADAPRRLGVLIDGLFERLGHEVVVLVAKLTQSGWPEPCERIDRFNGHVRGVVEERRGRGRRCLYVDMGHIGRGHDTIDGLHPNEIGFGKMAGVWVEALREADGLGWIQKLSSWDDVEEEEEEEEKKE